MSGTRVILDGLGKFDYGASDLRAEWKRWKRGFNSWLIGSEQDGKKESVKTNLLLTLLGSDGQDIFETFEFVEEQPKLMQVLEQFDSHFAGLSNVTMARFRFFGFSQGSKSVTEFVTGLKSLANDCEFGDLRDSLVKDMVVINCTSEKLRERLLKEPKLDLTKAVEIARIGEDAERNVETISSGADGGSAGALVAGGSRRTTNSRGGVGFRRPWKFDGECFECGEYGHPARDCLNQEGDERTRSARNRNCSSTANDRDGTRKTYAGYAAGWALGATTKGERRSGWFVDSGATQHMTSSRAGFDWYEAYRKPREVTLCDGSRVQSYGQGEIKMRVHAAAGIALVTMKNVQFVPKLRMSLLSVPATAKLGNDVIFQRQACIVSCGSLRLRCLLNKDGMYEVPIADDECGGVPHQTPTTRGCPTPGGVMVKPEHQCLYSTRAKNNYREQRANWATQWYDGSSRNQANIRMAEPRTHVGELSRFEDSPDT